MLVLHPVGPVTPVGGHTPLSGYTAHRAHKASNAHGGSRCSEEPLRLAYSVGQRIDLSRRVVHVERGAGARLNLVPAVQWPGTVMPGPHRDAEFVENLANVMRVDSRHRERDGSAPVGSARWAEDAHAGDLTKRRERVGGEHLLVRGHIDHAQVAEIAAGRREPD